MSLPQVASRDEWLVARKVDLTALGRQEDWEEPKGRTTSARGAVPDFSE